MRGVVFDGKRAEVVDDLAVRDPGPGEVLVAVSAAGLCHSDLSVVDGTIPFPVPVVLGHEGAGVVLSLIHTSRCRGTPMGRIRCPP
ncbi:alcohol dehydrogenase catalytic domain-containing protein, partial [Streptomyces scabiei]|uniref:alcohol dehydrogenase catalytic domain-containing protein n=1 Tax=Streptomyces scabiei TaxID=1930 RepID=UPI0029BD8EAA